MPRYLCKACGVQYAESAAPPPRCMICEDERQFVPKAGQEWLTPAELVHDADRQWITDPDPCVETWTGDRRELLPGLTLHRIGGHFPGNTVLHWTARRILLPGDTMLVTWDRKHVSFMWSYPNYVPLPAAEVTRIGGRLDALDFDTIHSAFWGRGDIVGDAKAAIARSIRRHIDGPDVVMDVPGDSAA